MIRSSHGRQDAEPCRPHGARGAGRAAEDHPSGGVPGLVRRHGAGAHALRRPRNTTATARWRGTRSGDRSATWRWPAVRRTRARCSKPGTPADIDAEPDRYAEVAEEICRGVMMTTLLDTNVSPVPGWVRVSCLSDAMAGWLLRAIVMENVAARGRRDGARSARGAAFPSRERDQERHHRDREDLALLARAHAARPAARHRQPVRTARQGVTAGRTIHDGRRTGGGCARRCRQPSTGIPACRRRGQSYAGWLGVDCPSVRSAIWMMRALVAGNVLSRREGTTLFVPVNRGTDPGGVRVARALARAHRLAAARNIH